MASLCEGGNEPAGSLKAIKVDDNLEIIEEFDVVITRESVPHDEVDPSTGDSGEGDSSYVFSRSGEKWKKFWNNWIIRTADQYR
ncbi:hypothetical protein ANN_13287 [Periplaneta americana]|uniref:Uncharacterized protein n=1 Tax=Periplaneta americana TaxID=6978 RepID=A0ABQ8TJ42_PERAM|nr:hypothetical protein ANN_13287 [Periplaneta americana]